MSGRKREDRHVDKDLLHSLGFNFSCSVRNVCNWPNDAGHSCGIRLHCLWDDFHGYDVCASYVGSRSAREALRGINRRFVMCRGCPWYIVKGQHRLQGRCLLLFSAVGLFGLSFIRSLVHFLPACRRNKIKLDSHVFYGE